MKIRIAAVVGAIAVAVGGYLHLEIWRSSYRFAPVKEMFLLNVGLSGAVAVAMLLHPRKLAAAAGLALSAGSLVAFGLSRGPGLPTLHGKFTELGLSPHNVRFLGAPAAVTLLAAEALAVLCCAGMLVAFSRGPARARGRGPGFGLRRGLGRATLGRVPTPVPAPGR